MSDLLTNDITGVLVAPFDHAAFSRALRAALRLPGDRTRAACRAIAERECGYGVAANRYAEVYQRAAGQRATS